MKKKSLFNSLLTVCIFLYTTIVADAQKTTHAVSQNYIYTIAGNGTLGFSGDNNAAISAELADPVGIAIDASGNIYIADNANNRVRMINTGGIITTIAGTGSGIAYNGDGIPATAADLFDPYSLAFDGSGNLYIADYMNNRVRKINTGGIISTIAGDSVGCTGDGGSAIFAKVAEPTGVAIDAAGNVYIADGGCSSIRKINTSGIISTIAGINGTPGFSGDNGLATAAELNAPFDVVVDGSGNVYISDGLNNRIRMINTAGVITTIAGNGTGGFSGDNGPATAAEIFKPVGMFLDGSGNLYFADNGNNRVREISSSGIITTVAGNGTGGFAGDNGPATAAELNGPTGVAIDGSGSLYIVDESNQRIRRVGPPCSITLTASASPASICSGSSTTLVAGGAVTYTWSPSSGLNTTTGSTVIATPLSTTSYTVNGTSSEGCPVSPQVVTVSVTSGPTVTASASPTTITSGSSATLTAAGATSYTWSPSTNLNATTGATVTATPTVTTTYTVTGTSGSCTNSSTVVVTVSGSGGGGTKLTITATASPSLISFGQSSVLTATGATTYTWAPGTGLNATTGASVTATPAVSTTYTVTGTTGSQTGSITVAVAVTPNGNISGPNSVGCSANYSVKSVAGATSYTWTAPTGATIVSGQGTNSITVDFGNTFISGQLSETASGPSGPISKYVINITGGGANLTVGAITGPTTDLCSSGTASATYSVTPVAGATSYSWTAPSNATVSSGQGTNTVTISFNSGFTSGSIYVAARNACASSSLRGLTVYSKITATPGAISGPTTDLCALGDSLATYSISAVAGASIYTWTAPTGATIVSGQGTTSVSVRFGSGFKTGSLLVTAGNSCGSGAATALPLASNITTEAGVISGTTSGLCKGTFTYSISSVTGASSYNWIVPAGSTLVSGQGTTSVTVSFDSVFKAGNLSVAAENACGHGQYRSLALSACSAPIIKPREEASEVNSVDLNKNVLVFPNPNKGSFTVDMNDQNIKEFRLKVYNQLGELLYTNDVKSSKTEANLTLTPGVYYLQIMTTDSIINKKMVVIQ